MNTTSHIQKTSGGKNAARAQEFPVTTISTNATEQKK